MSDVTSLIQVIDAIERTISYLRDQEKTITQRVQRSPSSMKASMQKEAETCATLAAGLERAAGMVSDDLELSERSPRVKDLQAHVMIQLARGLAPVTYRGSMDLNWLHRESRSLAKSMVEHGIVKA